MSKTDYTEEKYGDIQEILKPSIEKINDLKRKTSLKYALEEFEKYYHNPSIKEEGLARGYNN